jgi:hypothetical protein
MKHQSEGVCQLCKGKFTKKTMTSHLQKCLTVHDPAKGKEVKLLHLLVEGGGPYWLHVELPGTRTFADLDEFLRRTWLECCGHLSAFRLDDGALKRLGINPEWDFPDPMPGEQVMDFEIAEVLEPKLAFGYDYDMGSTTSLSLKVAGMRVGKWSGKKRVRLLARNLPPEWVCDECGKRACWVDSENEKLLCSACSDKEVDDEVGFLPVVNSPRMGVCGYAGEDA